MKVLKYPYFLMPCPMLQRCKVASGIKCETRDPSVVYGNCIFYQNIKSEKRNFLDLKETRVLMKEWSEKRTFENWYEKSVMEQKT